LASQAFAVIASAYADDDDEQTSCEGAAHESD
jgi:hypothetical protein